ncbi:rhophilin-1 isoform X2 [Rhinatrema bivittatum]|nr:rhophilin-1 isoform X2 [Rhinatrema bivittatum]
MDIYQNESEAISVPMIPLGLKETRELDLMKSLKESIGEQYGEDGSLYEKEIGDFMDLRQAMRTPSRSEAGIELLMEYYNQLYFLDNRFFPPNKTLGVFFHWYDSLTGVPSCQRALAFEKGSVLFNTGALYTQIGARQDRATVQGVDNAIDAFQKAAGAFNYLKENFSNAPSLDMSTASLNMLVHLMIAQVQECVFEKVTLMKAQNEFLTQLQTAQEAAQVANVYSLVYQIMTQLPMKDYIPFSWTTMVHVKSDHFKALSHYYAANALCDCSLGSETEFLAHEKAFLQFHVTVPEGPSAGLMLKDQEERRKLGKAHLKKAIMCHEEAMRIHGLCKVLRKMDILQEVLSFTHKRSLSKYSDIDNEEDFFETGDAPSIQPNTHQKPEITMPSFSKVKVADIFHRLGPLSVFSAKYKRQAVRRARLERGERGFGFTLRGDSPVLIAGVLPGSCAAEAGLKEGDYIVSVNGEDRKWAKHSEVVQQLKNVGEEGVEIDVITLQIPDAHNLVDKKPLMMSSSGLQKNKENRKNVMNSKSTSTLLAWNKKSTLSKRSATSSVLNLPFTVGHSNKSQN